MIILLYYTNLICSQSIIVQFSYMIFLFPAEDLIPYAIIRNGTCESNGLKMVSSKVDCEIIANAYKKMGYYSGWHDEWRYEGSSRSRSKVKYRAKTEVEVNILSTMWTPFGCLFKDDSEFVMYWAEPIPVQQSFPCGSTGKGIKFFCFCSRN